MVRSSRPRLIAVVRESCTGCDVCVDFCPVDCIDDVPHVECPEELTPPIRIREEDCIGCQVCAKVCEDLDRNAIEMVSIGEFECRTRIGRIDGGPRTGSPAMDR